MKRDISMELMGMSESECFELLDIVLDMNKDDIIKFITKAICSFDCDITDRNFQNLPISRIVFSDNTINGVMEELNMVINVGVDMELSTCSN